MMKIRKSIIAALAVAVLFVGLSGCTKNEGPGERAGKNIDKTMQQGGEHMENDGKKMHDGAMGK